MTNLTNNLTAEQFALLGVVVAHGPSTVSPLAALVGVSRDEAMQSLLTLSHMGLVSYDWDTARWAA